MASHIENPTACSSLANTRQPGVIIELWQGIDGYLIKKLLQDPRFPDMPTKVFHSPVFRQPRNWGNTYGTRIRGYFVPQKTGLHIFFIGKKTRHAALYLILIFSAWTLFSLTQGNNFATDGGSVHGSANPFFKFSVPC